MMNGLRGLGIGLVLAASVLPQPVDAGVDLIFVDGFESPPNCDMPGTPSCPGFTIETPPLQIPAEQAVAYCYYFRAPNPESLGIGRFSSILGAAVEHIIVYTTYDANGDPADRRPPGTLSPEGCGWGHETNGVAARRVYAAHDEVQQLDLPDDDGNGNPLAIEILPGQPMFIEMYLVNPGSGPISSSTRLRVNGLAQGSGYTRTATYMTYNYALSLPPLSTHTAAEDCQVPPDVRFWWFSTHTHRLATYVKLHDGTTTLVETTDWQRPTIATFGPPVFFQFDAGRRLHYECTYTNTNPFTVHSGESYEHDENCVGVGYFFPAERPLICLGNLGPL